MLGYKGIQDEMAEAMSTFSSRTWLSLVGMEWGVTDPKGVMTDLGYEG